jgi:siroheme synthase-like protein
MPANLFPAFIKLEGRAALVVGAGPVGASKIASLLDFAARVTVVAPSALSEVRDLAARGAVRWIQREFSPSDLDAVFIVIAATSSAAVNRAVFEQAQRRSILCNSVDDPPNCDFYFPAVVRRGDLQIAISTAGESPALAQRIHLELEEALDESLGQEVRKVGEIRRRILASAPPSEERKQLLKLLARHGITQFANDGSAARRKRKRSGNFFDEPSRPKHLKEQHKEENNDHALRR